MAAGPHVDLNADLGEGFGVWRLGADDELLDLVTSANIACGFHAGDPVTMRRVCTQAAARGVAIGAQVGYRDLAGFGRRRMEVEPDELYADVLYQIGALSAFAVAAGARVQYVKPHGALYSVAAGEQASAEAIAAAARDAGGLALLGLPGSAIADAAAHHRLRFVAEGFADRRYLANGRLAPRGEPDAVFTAAERVAAQAVALARDGVQSLCVHGDTPGAAELARAVRAGLQDAGVTVERLAW
jgi:UPF0271 protein